MKIGGTEVTVEELARIVRTSHWNIIHEADDFRPLARYILELCESVAREAREEALGEAEGNAEDRERLEYLLWDFKGTLRGAYGAATREAIDAARSSQETE